MKLKMLIILSSILMTFYLKSYADENSFELAKEIIKSNHTQTVPNTNALPAAASHLSTAEKWELYEKFEVNPWMGSILNIFLPTFGSFVIEDYQNATITGIVLLASCPFFAAGLIMDLYEVPSGSIYMKIASLGAYVFFGAYAYNIISPLFYAYFWNHSLKSDLGLTSLQTDPINHFVFNNIQKPKDWFHIDLIRMAF